MKQLIASSIKKFFNINGRPPLKSTENNVIKQDPGAAKIEADQGYVDLEKNIGYIPKIATTTILHALYEMRNGTPLDVEGKVPIHRWARDESLKLHNVKSFIVIRDPVKRFLSSYSNRVLYYRELSEEFVRRAHPSLAGTFPYDPELAEFIKNFQTYRQVARIDHHTKPLVEHLDGLDLNYFDTVYPIEKLKDLEAVLNNMYGTNVKFKRLQTGGAKFGVSELGETQLLQLFEIFDEDYALLKDHYSKDDLYAEWQRGQGR
jgi:hypothetical protein